MHAKSFAVCNGLFTVERNRWNIGWAVYAHGAGRPPSRARVSLISVVPGTITAALRKSGCLQTTSCSAKEEFDCPY
jgi:hypothetical protein